MFGNENIEFVFELYFLNNYPDVLIRCYRFWQLIYMLKINQIFIQFWYHPNWGISGQNGVHENV